MQEFGIFPFGQPVRLVAQQDRTPKRAFVLGVYASAVHARWTNPHGKLVVRALAVASEPYIFWHGKNAAQIIEQIEIPEALGQLLPAGRQLNGPSGRALDEQILGPLGLSRDQTWLCDLVPHSCQNRGQEGAIKRAYLPIAEQFGLPRPTVRPVPRHLADDLRRQEILQELQDSEAELLILLGDEPIKWFLAHFDRRNKRLSDFGQDDGHYGRLHDVQIGKLNLRVLPLAHPRQVAKLGSYSSKWFELHQYWLRSVAQHRLLEL